MVEHQTSGLADVSSRNPQKIPGETSTAQNLGIQRFPRKTGRTKTTSVISVTPPLGHDWRILEGSKPHKNWYNSHIHIPRKLGHESVVEQPKLQ